MSLEELKALARLRQDLAQADLDAARLGDELARASHALAQAPPGAPRAELAALAARLGALEAERARRALALEQRIDQCRAMLAELPAREARVLWLRYGEGLPWAQVARRAHYSEQHCKKIHKAALERRA